MDQGRRGGQKVSLEVNGFNKIRPRIVGIEAEHADHQHGSTLYATVISQTLLLLSPFK